MALGFRTIKILRARVALLVHENTALRRENRRMRTVLDTVGVRVDAITRDYGTGGHEWIDPVSGIDTWTPVEGSQ